MPALILLVLAGLGFAWWSGRLKGFTYEDGIAAALFLLGLKMLAGGKLLIGAILIAGPIVWLAYRRPPRRPSTGSMPIAEARALLGVGPEAGSVEINAAHRRLIARVHPDAGGSAELANKVNVARDILIADANRRTGRAF
jgi:hypothetical protein